MGPYYVPQIWGLRAEDKENGRYRIYPTQTFEMAKVRGTNMTGAVSQGTRGAIGGWASAE